MFQNKDNTQDILNLVKRQDENHLKMVQQFAEMGTTLKNLERLFTPTYMNENIVLQQYEKKYTANGYQFNSLFVGDAAVTDTAKLIINIDGISYTITLAAGENLVNIPDGASFKVTTTSNNPVTAVLLRYNGLRK